MKKYLLKRENDSTVHISNLDENRVIEKIEYSDDQREKRQRVRLHFAKGKETKEMRIAFSNITGNSEFFPLDYEYLSVSSDMNSLAEFLKIIQEIDPLPLSAFLEIKELINFDLTNFSFVLALLIEKMVKEGKHEQALQETLLADSKGDTEALQILANLYADTNDEGNYYNVLCNYPRTHVLYKESNEILHNSLQLLSIPVDEKKHIDLLEKKFRYALNAELPIADNYYDMLCGSNGLFPKVISVKGDFDTLINLARIQRNMLKELEELREYKRKNESELENKNEKRFSSKFF